jgi:hypothetical protein
MIPDKNITIKLSRQHKLANLRPGGLAEWMREGFDSAELCVLLILKAGEGSFR